MTKTERGGTTNIIHLLWREFYWTIQIGNRFFHHIILNTQIMSTQNKYRLFY